MRNVCPSDNLLQPEGVYYQRYKDDVSIGTEGIRGGKHVLL